MLAAPPVLIKTKQQAAWFMPRSLLCVFRLFAPQGDDGVLFRGDTRRDEAREECQQHTDRHEDNSSPGREGGHAAQTAQMVDDRIERQDEQQCDADADGACRKADGQRLGVEDAGDVAAGSADGAQNADLACPLQHGDIGDDADHDRRDDERNGDKGDENVADGVDDRRDGRDHQADIVRVG